MTHPPLSFPHATRGADTGARWRQGPRRILLVAPLALVLLHASQTAAYIIGAESVFERFANRQATDKPSSGAVVGQIAFEEPSGPEATEVRADVRFPGDCRFSIERADGTATVEHAGGSLTLEGEVPHALAAVAALGCPFATFKGVPANRATARIRQLVENIGADLSTVSLSHLDRRAAWVVGARPRDLDRPQVWFDKESNRVLRVIGRYDGRLWDVRFSQTSSLATAHRLPRQIEVYRDGTRRLAMRLMSTEVGGAEGEGGEEYREEEDED